MTTTYGAPTGLDLSACTLSADGGKTKQTLAALGAAVAGNATAVAAAQTDATDAKTLAAQASSDADNAKTAVGNLGDTYIPQTAYQNASGPAQYSSDGLTYEILPTAATTGMPQVALGALGSSQTVIVKVFAGGTSTDIDSGIDVCWLYRNGTSNFDGDVNLHAAVLQPEVDGGPPLGGAGNRWNGVYSNSGTIQTSDANEKTVVGVIGDASYTDSAKLIAAGKAIRSAVTVFTFNDGGTRKHVGAIAQSVAAALTAAGLTPSDFGIWCEDPLTQQVAVKDGKGVITGYEEQPIIDSTTGKQKVRQSLRYDELSMLLIAAGEAEAKENAAALAALTTRVAALEAKAGS